MTSFSRNMRYKFFADAKKVVKVFRKKYFQMCNKELDVLGSGLKYEQIEHFYG